MGLRQGLFRGPGVCRAKKDKESAIEGRNEAQGGRINYQEAEVRDTPAKERENMKKRMLTVMGSVALALTLAAWSAGATEKGSGRGGAGDLLKPATPVSGASSAVVMECPKCKSDWLVRTDFGARGATKPTYVAEKHLCSKCSTELKLVGTGKQAENIPIHLCKMCAK